MMMAVTPDDPDYLYILQAAGGGFGGLFLSTDEGATFTTQSDNSSGTNNIMGYNMAQGGGQAPRDMDVVVSPTDKTEVHVAGIMTFKSTDSGSTWTQTLTGSFPIHYHLYMPIVILCFIKMVRSILVQMEEFLSLLMQE